MARQDSATVGRSGAVLIVGAGLAGMQSALLLAEAGSQVYLLDSAPGIGGSLHLLDRTFPTDSCGLCIMLPTQPAYCPTLECDLHPNIEILAYADVGHVEEQAGDFRVTIEHKPRYVDMDKCTRCGKCVEVCPEPRPSEYEGQLHMERAIYRPPLRAVPNAYVIDDRYCTRCGRCAEVCPAGAVDLDMAASQSEINVEAVILSPGFRPFDPTSKGEYGYGRYPNVLTSVQFERMMSLAGSTQAHLQRPSDGQPPRRIAFVQCVGSRDSTVHQEYCSSVCCMYTAKQVGVAKELMPDLEVVVFYIDIRTFGEDFERYFNRVEGLEGVDYRRSLISGIKEVPSTRNLLVGYAGEDGRWREDEFDMVVLAVGFAPPDGFQSLGRNLEVALNRFGFCVTDVFSPNRTSREGVFVSGAFREPKDIPETVVEACSAAASALDFLAGRQAVMLPLADGDTVTVAVEPTEREKEIADEEPRIGVFVCACGKDVGQVVDVDEVAEFAARLPGVTLARPLPDACEAGGLRAIRQAIEEHNLNRVVVAACSPRLYQPEFTGVMKEAGLNPYLLERANIREQCAWVHEDDPRSATDKARGLVEMSVVRAGFDRPVHPVAAVPRRGALVIGGGVAGMTAALSLARQGHRVDVVEREAELGGHLRDVFYTLEGRRPGELLADLVSAVEANALITVHRSAEVRGLIGGRGDFTATVVTANGEEQRLRHGAVIVATGAREAPTDEYLYGQDPRVVTQLELEARISSLESQIANGEPLADGFADSVVMIQCVGSRDESRPYCSRVCCSQAVKNALRIKELSPETQVSILYRDIRTYGFREPYYRRAREEGVVFIRYQLPDKPRVEADGGGLRIRLRDLVLDRELELRPDLLVLSTGIVPHDGNAALAKALGVPLNQDGFFQEDHNKVRPLDFHRPGIFLCGLAHSPRFIEESICQGQGAAIRAGVILSKPALQDKGGIAVVDERLCSGCGLCVSVCPYSARTLDEERHVARVLELLCQGCGNCVATCPNKASSLRTFNTAEVLAMVDAVL